MDLIPITITTLLSYKVCNLVTNPNSKVWHKMPHVKLNRFEFLPSIRIKVKGKYVHFHHWFNFSLILAISIFFNIGFLENFLARGFLMGGIIQGLSIPSARRLIYNK